MQSKQNQSKFAADTRNRGNHSMNTTFLTQQEEPMQQQR